VRETQERILLPLKGSVPKEGKNGMCLGKFQCFDEFEETKKEG